MFVYVRCSLLGNQHLHVTGSCVAVDVDVRLLGLASLVWPHPQALALSRGRVLVTRVPRASVCVCVRIRTAQALGTVSSHTPQVM